MSASFQQDRDTCLLLSGSLGLIGFILQRAYSLKDRELNQFQKKKIYTVSQLEADIKNKNIPGLESQTYTPQEIFLKNIILMGVTQKMEQNSYLHSLIKPQLRQKNTELLKGYNDPPYVIRINMNRQSHSNDDFLLKELPQCLKKNLENINQKSYEHLNIAGITTHLSDPVFPEQKMIVKSLTHAEIERKALDIDVICLNQIPRTGVSEFFQWLGSWTLGLLSQIVFFWCPPLVYGGIQMGLEEREMGLTFGSPMTVCGDVKYNFETNIFTMEKTQSIIFDKSLKTEILKFDIQQFKAWALFFGSLSAIFGVAAYLHHLRIPQQSQFTKLEAYVVNPSDNSSCSICMENVRSLIFIPCNHLVSCEACYKLNQQKQCPICQEKIVRVIQIFVA